MKAKTTLIIAIVLIPVFILWIWFFSDFRRNAFRYLNIGLYGSDCGRYGRCASFKDIAEAEEISLRIRCWGGDDYTREGVNGITTLYIEKYWNRTWWQIPNDRSVVLNTSGVVKIWGKLHTYLYGRKYWSKEGRNKIE